MIDASQLPSVPNTELLKQQDAAAVEYARAPVAPGAPHGTGRPPAVQGTTR
jgi:hypothetical protein